MTEGADKLLAQYQEIMALCEEFHNNNGGADVLKQVEAITTRFNRLVEADKAAGMVLEAGHYMGLGAALRRIACRY